MRAPDEPRREGHRRRSAVSVSPDRKAPRRLAYTGPARRGLGLPEASAVPRPHPRVAEDAAKVQRRSAAGDAEPLRYLQLAHSRRGTRELSYQDSVAERRGGQSSFAPVL